MIRFLEPRAAMRIGVLLTLAALPLARQASACASVGDITSHIQVVDESAVIVWDAAAQQERFIRRATFRTTSANFGFLVPTPSVPKLSVAGDTLFRYLELLIQPKIVEQKQLVYSASSLLFPQDTQMAGIMPLSGGMDITRMGSDPASVRLLKTQQVGDYNAVVLSADNAEALRRWLKSHGYSAPPELLTWLAPYIQAHWNITAFKVSKDSSDDRYVDLTAVEMTFHTSRPFFPYREPANQRVAGNYGARSLRVFLLSADRMEGRLGENGAPSSWPGKVTFADAMKADARQELQAALKLPAHPSPSPLWLTTYVDNSSPRPGTDEVYFTSAAQQTPVAPPPIIVPRVEHVYIPVEPFLLLTAGVFFGAMLHRRWDLRSHRRARAFRADSQ